MCALNVCLVSLARGFGTSFGGGICFSGSSSTGVLIIDHLRLDDVHLWHWVKFIDVNNIHFSGVTILHLGERPVGLREKKKQYSVIEEHI